MPISIESHEKDFLFALVKEGLFLATTQKRKLTEKEVQSILLEQFSEYCQERKSLISGNLKEKMGAFVSYFIDDSRVQNKENSNSTSPQKRLRGCIGKRLRGCIGMMVGQLPLWATVADMAYKAAREDTRFPAISEQELPYISYDITALEPMTICQNPEKIELGKHGILLQAHNRHAVFLPHVPIEQGWTLEETFEHLCLKAQLPKDTWKEPETVFYWYEGLLMHP